MLAVAGSFVCCSVVVLFVCVVLLCVLFEGFHGRWCVCMMWYCGKIARLDVWRWYCGLWAGSLVACG